MRLVKIVAGLAIGIAFWYFAVPEYAFVTKRLAGAVAPSLFERGWQVGGTGGNANVYRANGSIAATVFMRYLTTNVITLLVLFAMSARPFSFRNLVGAGGGLAALIPVHALAILIVAKSIVLPQSLWANAAQAYTIFGSHALAFALWWLLRPQDGAPASGRKRSKKK